MACFDRTDESAALWEHFRAGRNLLMLAPRRIGKTVLLNHLRETASDNGFRAIVLDVEGLPDEKAFFRECCASIQEELSTGKMVMSSFAHRLAKLLRGTSDAGDDWRQWLLETEWRQFADHLFSHLDRNFNDPDRTRLYRIMEAAAKAGGQGVDGGILLAALSRGDHQVSALDVRDLVDTLETDGYLVRGADGRWRFLMALLREWWLRYVVL